MQEDDDKLEVSLDDSSDEQRGSEDRGDEVALSAQDEGEGDQGQGEAGGAKAEDETEGNHGVPLKRFQEINDERKALREEIAAMREELATMKNVGKPQEQEKEPPFDFELKEREFLDSLLEGEHDKAMALRAEIRQAEMIHARDVAANAARETYRAARDQELLTHEATAAVEKYPFLGDGGNQAAIEEVREWRDFYITRGQPPHTALRKAVERIAPLYESHDTERKPESTAIDRAREARARGADAAQRQPPKIRGGVGARGMPLERQVEKMSDEEFEKLPAEDKRRARGDFAA